MTNEDFKVTGSLPAIIRNDAGMYEGDLRHYFKVLFLESESVHKSYHNFGHNGNHLWLSHDAIVYYDALKIDAIGTLRERRNLLVASFNHDLNHTGMKGPDSVNIDQAIKGFIKYCHRDDLDSQTEIAELIGCTEYPHRNMHATSLHMLIMRDADMAQGFSPRWIQPVVFGLAHEKGKNPLEILNEQEGFYENLQFATQWARWRFPQSAIDSKICEIRELIALLK